MMSLYLDSEMNKSWFCYCVLVLHWQIFALQSFLLLLLLAAFISVSLLQLRGECAGFSFRTSLGAGAASPCSSTPVNIRHPVRSMPIS